MEISELFILALESDGLVTGLRGFFLPLILFGVALAAVGFLIERRLAGLIGFIAVVILVVSMMVEPDWIENTGRWVGGLLAYAGLFI